MFMSRAKAVKAAARISSAGTTDPRKAAAAAASTPSAHKMPDLMTFLEGRDYVGAVTVLEVCDLIQYRRMVPCGVPHHSLGFPLRVLFSL